MKRLTSWIAVGLCTALIGFTFAAKANARNTDEAAMLRLTEPLDVGGRILQPGDYHLKIVAGRLDRNLLQVWNADDTKLFATLLTVPHPEGPAGVQVSESRYVYYPASAGHITALRTWFAGTTPRSGGHDIVYPKQRAAELAALVAEPVVATEEDVKEADLETAPLVVVTPEKEVKPYEEPPMKVAEASPVPVPVPEELPKTASNVPLYAGLGLLSLIGALGLGVLARRGA